MKNGARHSKEEQKKNIKLEMRNLHFYILTQVMKSPTCYKKLMTFLIEIHRIDYF